MYNKASNDWLCLARIRRKWKVTNLTNRIILKHFNILFSVKWTNQNSASLSPSTVIFLINFVGSLYDWTGNYNLSFYVAGSTIALAGIICFPLRRIARWQHARELEKQRRAGAVKDSGSETTSSTDELHIDMRKTSSVWIAWRWRETCGFKEHLPRPLCLLPPLHPDRIGDLKITSTSPSPLSRLAPSTTRNPGSTVANISNEHIVRLCVSPRTHPFVKKRVKVYIQFATNNCLKLKINRYHSNCVSKLET